MYINYYVVLFVPFLFCFLFVLGNFLKKGYFYILPNLIKMTKF